MIIGENLKEARKYKGLTQKQYSRFENGVFELNYDQILFLCDFLDMTPNELFNVEYKKHSSC